jgi:hypothetical protein
MRNDEKLIRVGHLVPVRSTKMDDISVLGAMRAIWDPTAWTGFVRCRTCRAEFISDENFRAHDYRRHQDRLGRRIGRVWLRVKRWLGLPIQCEFCNDAKMETPAQTRIDPYALEIWDQTIRGFICRTCYAERRRRADTY